MKYLFGFTLIAIGVFEILKTEWLIQNFGYIQWAEDKIGSGGTWTFHKILGVFLIFFSFIIMSGQIIDILDWIFIR